MPRSCSFQQYLSPHHAKIEYVEDIVAAQVGGLPLVKLGSVRSRKPFLEHDQIGDIEQAVSVHIASDNGRDLRVVLGDHLQSNAAVVFYCCGVGPAAFSLIVVDHIIRESRVVGIPVKEQGS